MRFNGWTHKRGDQDGSLISLGRKMLGAMKARSSDGVKTLSDRLVLDDGTVVTAEWIYGIPRITVTKPESSVSPFCEVNVQSGMLDLGIDYNAARFLSGIPSFNEDPSQLYFGDDMDCTVYGGLNGKVVYSKSTTQGGFQSSCIGEAGDPNIDSKLSSSEKKKVQSLLPASCWTGLMHRYIAALYGGGKSYEMHDTEQSLLIGETPVSPYTYTSSGCYGLVDIPNYPAPDSGKTLAFVNIDVYGNINFRRVVLSECGSAIKQYYDAVKGDATYDQKSRLMTIWLSEAKPGEIFYTTSIKAIFSNINDYYGGVQNFANSYCFSANQAKVIGVCNVVGINKIIELSFDEISNDVVTVTGTETTTPDVKNAHISELFFVKTASNKRESERHGSSPPVNVSGQVADTPIKAWYGFELDDTSPLDKYVLYDYYEIAATPSGPATDQDACNAPVYINPDDSYGTAQSCTTSGPRYDTISLSSGVYVKKNGSPFFSSIKTSNGYIADGGSTITREFTTQLRAFDTTIYEEVDSLSPISHGVSGVNVAAQASFPVAPNGHPGTVEAPLTGLAAWYTGHAELVDPLPTQPVCMDYLSGGVFYSNTDGYPDQFALSPVNKVGDVVDVDGSCNGTLHAAGAGSVNFVAYPLVDSIPGDDITRLYKMKTVRVNVSFKNNHYLFIGEIVGNPRNFTYAHAKTNALVEADFSARHANCSAPSPTGIVGRALDSTDWAYSNIPDLIIGNLFATPCASVVYGGNTYSAIGGGGNGYSANSLYGFDFTYQEYNLAAVEFDYNRHVIGYDNCGTDTTKYRKIKNNSHTLICGVFDGAENTFDGDQVLSTDFNGGPEASLPPSANISCTLYGDIIDYVTGSDPAVNVTYSKPSVVTTVITEDDVRANLMKGFLYTEQVSLLGARVSLNSFSTTTLLTGNSLNSDRHTFTGGYPAVNNPSFIGWA